MVVVAAMVLKWLIFGLVHFMYSFVEFVLVHK